MIKKDMFSLLCTKIQILHCKSTLKVYKEWFFLGVCFDEDK
jgi:hypothetical protein